jgi:hypothetical protein
MIVPGLFPNEPNRAHWALAASLTWTAILIGPLVWRETRSLLPGATANTSGRP